MAAFIGIVIILGTLALAGIVFFWVLCKVCNKPFDNEVWVAALIGFPLLVLFSIFGFKK